MKDRHSQFTTNSASDEHTQYLYRVPFLNTNQGGVSSYYIPSIQSLSGTTQAIVLNYIYYAPFAVDTSIQINLLAVEVTTLAAGASARFGIYRADRNNLQPTTLVVDSGAVAVSSTGVKSAEVSATLTPGMYLSAFVSDGQPSIRTIRGGSRYTGISPTNTTGSPYVYVTRVAYTYAALPSTGLQSTLVTYSATPHQQFLFMRVV